MLPDFPESKSLIRTFISQIIKASLRHHSGPFFQDVPEKPINEGGGFISKYSDSLSHETDLKKIAGSTDFNKEEMLGDKNIIVEKLFDIGKQMAEQQVKMMFETISDVTEKAGNVVQTKSDVTPEDIFKIYSKIAISFNSDGTPVLPTIVAGTDMFPKMKKALDEIFNNEEYKKRFEEIIETQKQKWHDRENNRKLVG